MQRQVNIIPIWAADISMALSVRLYKHETWTQNEISPNSEYTLRSQQHGSNFVG